MNDFKIDDIINNNNNQNIYERVAGRVIDLYLNDTIEGPSEYVNWNQCFRNCAENDVVILHINCYGGDIMTTIQLLRSMSECKGRIIASIEGACMSAATFLFLSADICEVSDHTQFLVHNYSSGNWGKGNELISRALAEHTWAKRLLTDIYSDFMTPQEIESVIEGKDFWMDSKEVIKRLSKRNDIRENPAPKTKAPRKPRVPKQAKAS